MELKIAFTLKKKDKIIRKLNANFFENADEEEEEDEEDEEEEQEQTQGPMKLTQGLGEDKEEEETKGVEGEETKEAPIPTEPNKRKANA